MAVYLAGEYLAPSDMFDKCLKAVDAMFAAANSIPEGPQRHELKVWPEYYAAIDAGKKTLELRKDDRGFQVGDSLLLREFDPKTGIYGESCERVVTHIVQGGHFGIADGYVAMSISEAIVPEGAPVGTIARRPDGEWIAWRTEDGWGYRFIGDEEPNEWPPGSNIADSWPVIYDPTKPEPEVTKDTSDGHHTFAELYHYRMLYNALLFNEWAAQGKYDVHKSERHSDGELCFGGGWFIVSAQLPTGQVTNHYRLEYWNLFKFPSRVLAAQWDGHTPQIVADRLEALAVDMSFASDPTAQQEPVCSSVSDDYVSAHKPRTPRVVDRLGVDEQGARWRDRDGDEYWFNGHRWCDSGGSDGKYEYLQGYEPNMASPYTEVLPDVG